MRAQSLIALLAICSVGVSSSSTLLSVHSENRISATPERLETSKGNRSKLRKHDRLRLVEAQAQGEKELTLLIASVEGANQSVLRLVASLGGSVQYRDDDVSYLRVKIPTYNVEKLARSLYIQSLNINGLADYLNSPSPEPSTSLAISNPVPPPNKNTPAENPYLPSRDIGSPQFVGQHPTFDGRGATIGIVDASIDILSPELQTAKTLDGQPTRKIANVLTAERDALVPNYENSRFSAYVAINMAQELTAQAGKLTHEGVTYAVPALATFRLGILNERMNNAKDDLNRDGNPENSSGLFAVLWHEKTNTVWIDINQNHSFLDEKPMTDYHVNNNVGIFGKDDPATPIRETVGFTIQTDATHKVVYILPGNSRHGTGVAGVAAGKNFFGGQISGVAPEAQIISVPFGGPPLRFLPSAIESTILAVKHPQVDVVSAQFGSVVALNDGGSTLAIIFNRLIEKYKKLIFFAASNAVGDEVNFIDEGAAGSKTIAVGSYINRETARTNYGVVTAQEHNIDAFSSRGPAKNGLFKPNVLAPTMSLTTMPGFLPSQSYGTYELPPGYGVMGGTSTSTPFAAGAAALLISAAKQSGVKYDADRLRWAIMSSARYLQNYGAHEQGAGCFQVGAAWEALKNAPDPIEIISRAPVAAALSQYLEVPHRGVGIFEREGWSAGQSGERSIVLTRTSGDSKPTTFRLRWLGNDGTFSSPSSVTLPPNSPVTIPISIVAKTPGVHSAILNLDIPGGPSAIYQIMSTIVVADQFIASSGFTVTGEAQADWMSQSSWYLNVPAGARALELDVKIVQGTVMPYLMRPSGAVYWPLAMQPVPPSGYQGAGTWSRIISRPDAGVWQLVITNKNTGEKARLASPNRAIVTMSATVLTATASQTVRPLELLSADSNYIRDVSFTNQFGPFLGGVSDLPLGSAFSETATIDANGPLRSFELTIPPGTRTLYARIDGASEASADLDLYLFDCTKDTCKLKDFSTNDHADEEVEVQGPAAGKWKVLVDPFSVKDKIRFSYFDFFAHPAFGILKSTAKPSYRPSGTKWTERVNVRVEAMPAGSRYLAGFITVTAQPETNLPSDATTTPPQDAPNLAAVPLGVTKITVRKSEKAARASLGSRE